MIHESLKIISELYPDLSYLQIEQAFPTLDNHARAKIILEQFRNLPLEFPFGHYYISDKDAKIKLERLRNYKPVWTNQRYLINQSELSIGKRFPLLFNSKPMLFIPTDSEYLEIDNLTCAFTDPSRMAGFRYVPGVQTRSPLEGWQAYGDYPLAAIKDCLDKRLNINAFNLREGLYAASKSRDCPYTECAHERLTFLKAVFSEIRAITSSLEFRIFDTCSGWGDRLLVAIVFEAEYVGVEPNSKSAPGFDRMIGLLGNRKRHRVLLDACPSVILPEHCVDGYFSVCFLSPPAYNSEFYSDDSGQSVNMFSNYEQWTVEFLFKTIDLAWSKLAVGGVLVVQSLLAAKINTYIYNMCYGSQYYGALSMRTGRNRNKPLWIWMKTSGGSRIIDHETMLKTFGKDILHLLSSRDH